MSAGWFKFRGSTTFINEVDWLTPLPSSSPVSHTFFAYFCSCYQPNDIRYATRTRARLIWWSVFVIDLFEPLFEVTQDPASHPELYVFLQRVVGFDCVDDESKPEKRWVQETSNPVHLLRSSERFLSCGYDMLTHPQDISKVPAPEGLAYWTKPTILILDLLPLC